jgi:putative DNA primase/helicase
MTVLADQLDVARSVRIEDEIARRGVKLRGRTDRAGPCPRCGGDDRFSVHIGDQVFNCRGCGGKGRGAIDLVMFLDGSGFKEAVAMLAGFAPERTACSISKQREQAVKKCEDNSAMAAWLWSRRNPITENCSAGLYLREARGYSGPIPATLGYLPANDKHPPAMIAAFGFCNEPESGVIDPPAVVTGIHLTRLAPDGRKAAIEPVKIMLGVMSGLPVVLAPVNDGLGLAITEGIEDGLSVFEETGLGVWAAGSGGNMPKIAAALPPYVECITIFAHRDETGLRFAKEAARLIAATEVEVHIKGRG